MNMSNLNGVIACAKRGGNDFLSSVRPNPKNFINIQCPDDYVPCSNLTSRSETICVTKLANCPILDILLIDESFASTWESKGYTVSDKSFGNSEGTNSKLAFSKTTNTRYGIVGALEPIIDTAMNTFTPCFGYDSERLILSDYQIENAFFKFEKEMPISECEKYNWNMIQE